MLLYYLIYSFSLIAKLSPSLSSNWAVAGSNPSFSDRPADRPAAGRPTIRNSTFQASYDLNLKSKVVNLNGKTLEISLDLNPIGQGGYLALF